MIKILHHNYPLTFWGINNTATTQPLKFMAHDYSHRRCYFCSIRHLPFFFIFFTSGKLSLVKVMGFPCNTKATRLTLRIKSYSTCLVKCLLLLAKWLVMFSITAHDLGSNPCWGDEECHHTPKKLSYLLVLAEFLKVCSCLMLARFSDSWSFIAVISNPPSFTRGASNF